MLVVMYERDQKLDGEGLQRAIERSTTRASEREMIKVHCKQDTGYTVQEYVQ